MSTLLVRAKTEGVRLYSVFGCIATTQYIAGRPSKGVIISRTHLAKFQRDYSCPFHQRPAGRQATVQGDAVVTRESNGTTTPTAAIDEWAELPNRA